MTILDKAINYATQAHSGATRKGKTTPYILHPLEAASIAATMTDDLDIISAAVLHDVLEDTPIAEKDLRESFGNRITDLVLSNSENKREELPAAATWRIRKQETIDHCATASPDEKIVIFSDKLANLRSLYRDYLTVWEDLWQRFNQKDPELHLWYYGSFLDTCSELRETDAYLEYKKIFENLRSYVQEYIDYGKHGGHLRIMVTPDEPRWVIEDMTTKEFYILQEDEFMDFMRHAAQEE